MWNWEQPSIDDEPERAYLHPSGPPVASLDVSDREEIGRLYGPRGEVIRVAYDRSYQPFGFAPNRERA